MRMNRELLIGGLGAAGLLIGAAGCATGPRYEAPAISAPPIYKESADWKPAQPVDDVFRGKWWESFRDDELNALEDQVEVSNQSLKSAEAQFREARAALRSARAAYAPQLTLVPGTSLIDQSANRPLHNPAASTRYNDYILPADVSYEADVWGRIRHTVDASHAGMQASAADLESANLSVHAELALDYFSLRAVDAEKQLLDETVSAFQRAVELTQTRFKGGVAAAVDVAQAETQLETTRAQAVDDEVRRAELEHAIALLVGQPASSFSLAAAPLGRPPQTPPGLPSDLLERRPDVAAAERRVAAANAQIGVRTSAFYPLLTLGGGGGVESAHLGDWLRAASGFWTAAPAAAVTIFDGGRRRALSDQAKAAYDAAVAGYQETVLTAFREVEDNLSTLRVLENEAQIQDAAVAAAERSLAYSTTRYRGGVSTYLEVITAQSAALFNQRAALGLQERRLTASVLLIKALGGGWTRSSLPQ